VAVAVLEPSKVLRRPITIHLPCRTPEQDARLVSAMRHQSPSILYLNAPQPVIDIVFRNLKDKGEIGRYSVGRTHNEIRNATITEHFQPEYV
jgi:hypothetical protein